ncbi:MAG: hypothetical protein HY814_01720 [Candidatus Riflebacteria bacterium]|nr:hypothetical protein [Candidatus Riflebacteria bacterium]
MRSTNTVSTPSPVWKSLPEALELSYNNDEVKELADLLGLKVPARKSERVEAVSSAILGTGSTVHRLETLWAELDDLQKAAVAETLHGSTGFFDGSAFEAKYGGQPSWTGGKDRWGRPNGPSRLCLFLLRVDKHTWGRTIPADLARRLMGLVPRPRQEQLATLDIPRPLGEEDALTIRLTESSAQQELFSVLRLVDMGRVQVSDATLRPSAKAVAAVAETLSGGDFYGPDDESKDKYVQRIGAIRAFAWPLLVQAAGLAKAAGTRLALTPAGRKALTRPAPELLSAAWKAWLRNTFFDEFSRIDVIKGQSERRHLTAVAGRRETIAGVLRTCPAGRWIEVDELSRHMQASGAVFEVTRNPWKLYIADAHYGSLGYQGCGGWNILQGRYLLTFLFEYAATLGLIDVAYASPLDAREDYHGNWGVDDLRFLSRYDGLVCFRINALGACVLGISGSYETTEAAPAGSLKVLPNLDVVTTRQRFDPGDEAFLAAFCTRRSENVFSLDRRTALEAIDKGHVAEELRAFLSRSSEGGFQDTVRCFLEDLEKRAGMLSEVGHALLVDCADEIVALQIANDSRTRALCRLAAPRTLVVPAQSEAAFKRAAFALGYPVRPLGAGSR